MLPKSFSSTNARMRACLYSHYDGGSGNDVLSFRPWWDIGYQLPILGLDYDQGNVSPWANLQQMSDMGSGYTYLNSTLGAARGGKINLLGFSMGGCNSLIYAAHNSSKVNAVLVGSPALSLYSGMYAPGVQSYISNPDSLLNIAPQINNAYGVTKTHNAYGYITPTWMTSTSDPTWGTSGGFGTTVASNRDPYWMAANGYASAFAGLPIVIVQGGVKLTCSLTAATFSSGTATATLTGAGITTSNVTVGMWLTWQGMSNQLTGQVTAVSAGSATVTLTAYDGTGSLAAQTSAPFWLSNDGTTWPIWAEQFAANVNAVAGGNVQMIYDNLGGHGLFSDAAVAQALMTWMPYA